MLQTLPTFIGVAHVSDVPAGIVSGVSGSVPCLSLKLSTRRILVSSVLAVSLIENVMSTLAGAAKLAGFADF